MNTVAACLSFDCPGWLLTELAARYAEPQRRYHTGEHVLSCFRARDALLAAGAPLPRAETVDLALLFHDAVYEPLAADNEERSAALLLALGRRAALDEGWLPRAAELVLLTRHADALDDAHGADDAALVLDADLSILASDDATFARYENDVRAEYALVDDRSYARGRAHVLSTLLEQPTLYRTLPGQVRWEAVARANMGRSLRDLATLNLPSRSPSPGAPLAP